MQKKKIVSSVIHGSGFVHSVFRGVSTAEKKQEGAQNSKAQNIGASADVTSNHPEIPEGASCNDCHDMTIDANTTATQDGER